MLINSCYFVFNLIYILIKLLFITNKNYSFSINIFLKRLHAFKQTSHMSIIILIFTPLGVTFTK